VFKISRKLDLKMFSKDLNRMIFQNLKPVGTADFTASTASDAIPHSSLLRDSIFLVATATPSFDGAGFDNRSI